MFFFFNDTAPTEIYTLSLHDALPICADADLDPAQEPERREPLVQRLDLLPLRLEAAAAQVVRVVGDRQVVVRSEEHTSELQSRQYLVCRLLLEKKKKRTTLMNLPRSV